MAYSKTEMISGRYTSEYYHVPRDDTLGSKIRKDHPTGYEFFSKTIKLRTNPLELLYKTSIVHTFNFFRMLHSYNLLGLKPAICMPVSIDFQLNLTGFFPDVSRICFAVPSAFTLDFDCGFTG